MVLYSYRRLPIVASDVCFVLFLIKFYMKFEAVANQLSGQSKSALMFFFCLSSLQMSCGCFAAHGLQEITLF